MDFIRNNKVAVGVAGLLGLVVVAVLAFGVFGVQTLFFDNEVNEAGPVFDSAAASDDAVSEPAGTAEPTETTAPAAEPTDEPDETAVDPQIETIATGVFQDSKIHAGSGDVNVLTDGNQRFLRFEENFATDNGPDLNVYLRADDGSFIDLGDLKGNIGSQNYEIPADVDLDVYNRIDIWCVRFGVSFADASLA